MPLSILIFVSVVSPHAVIYIRQEKWQIITKLNYAVFLRQILKSQASFDGCRTLLRISRGFLAICKADAELKCENLAKS